MSRPKLAPPLGVSVPEAYVRWTRSGDATRDEALAELARQLPTIAQPMIVGTINALAPTGKPLCDEDVVVYNTPAFEIGTINAHPLELHVYPGDGDGHRTKEQADAIAEELYAALERWLRFDVPTLAKQAGISQVEIVVGYKNTCGRTPGPNGAISW